MNDTTVGDFLAWQKALYHDETLRKMAQKSEWDLRQTAIVMASFGQLGTGCFAGAETVANLIGCHYNTIKRHRAELIRLGWFTPAGRNRRAVVLNISNPLADHIRVPLLADHPDGPILADHEPARAYHLDGPLPVIDPTGLYQGGVSAGATPPSAEDPRHDEKTHAASPASGTPSRRGNPYCYECRKDLVAGHTCPFNGFSHSDGYWDCRTCGKESVWAGFDEQGQMYYWCNTCEPKAEAA